MERIDELFQERASLVTEQRRILDKAEAENRDLTAEEDGEYRKMDADLDSLETRIERLRDHRERQRGLAEAEQRGNELARETRGAAGGSPDSEQASAEYRKVFEKYLRSGLETLEREERSILSRGLRREERDLTTSQADTPKAGYTVPEDFYGRLVNKLEEQSGIRSAGATVLTTAGGNDMPVPKVTSHAAASWVAEGADMGTSDDDVFGEVVLEAWKNKKMVKVNVELLEDTGVDLIGYISNEAGRAIGRLEGDAYAVGDGTSKPEGLVPNATVGVTAASGTAITADEVIDLVYSVPRPYRAGSAFLLNDALVKIIRKLKDGNSDYIWQDSFQDGEPARLLGYPVYTEPGMDAAPAINDITIAFGNMAGYFIRDVRGVTLIRLNERFMDEGKVGFLAWHRTDGALVDDNAIRTLQQAAA